MRTKEDRYRLLLELYPADFRREYADEMIGVLMADSGPVRRHAASLLGGAVTARLKQRLDGPQWRRAAFVAELFGAILLCAVALRRFAMATAITLFEPAYNRPPFDDLNLVRVVAWALVVVATLTGLRALSVAGALAGLAVEIAAPSRFYAESPVTLLGVFWIVMSAAVVLIAATVSARGPRPRGWLLVTAAGVVLAANGFSARSPYSTYAFTITRAILLGAVQWAALILIPAAAFWVAAGLNVRLERSRQAVPADSPAAAA